MQIAANNNALSLNIFFIQDFFENVRAVKEDSFINKKLHVKNPVLSMQDSNFLCYEVDYTFPITYIAVTVGAILPPSFSSVIANASA
jgi:hypothetical protein